MGEDVKEKINSMYATILEKPNILYSIFCDFFGEDLVDMQVISLEEYTNYVQRYYTENNILECTDILGINNISRRLFILVRFPEVRVTNEHDKFIDIWELYAEIGFTYEGKSVGYFGLNRAEYDVFQFSNNYLHSHVNGISKNNLTYFSNPCLGEGPIKNTLAQLVIDFDELRWQLFCLELSKYVQVESLNGGPYNRLEDLGSNTMYANETNWRTAFHDRISLSYNSLSITEIEEFTVWMLKRGKLKFDYMNSYGISMSFLQWLVFISNEFIEWYNIKFTEGEVTYTYLELLNTKVLQRGIINNNKIYYDNRNSDINLNQYIGKKICTFKGQEITLSIRDINISNEDNFSNFLNANIAEHIYRYILETINYEYRKNNTETQTSGVSKKTIFI